MAPTQRPGIHFKPPFLHQSNSTALVSILTTRDKTTHADYERTSSENLYISDKYLNEIQE